MLWICEVSKMVIKNRAEDKILEVNNEIETVYQYCINAGLTHQEIVEKAGPLLRPIRKKEMKKSYFLLLKIGICLIAISLACSSEPLTKAASARSRFFLLKILHLWDWTNLYNENCAVRNPYYLDQQIVETNCQVCEDLYGIEHLNRTFYQEISELFMQRDVPVIVSDAISDWPAMDDSFTISNLTEGYISISEGVCKLKTNLRTSSHFEVFRKILSKHSIGRWYVHWENCGQGTWRFLRKFYSRPYFLSDLVQMTEANWIFMSSNYRGKKFKKVEMVPSISVMWVAQIRGYQYIRLDPKEPCEKTCNPLEDTIEEGDIVVFNPTLWDFYYLPGEDAENLAIAAEGYTQF